jgi:HSP20 family protein
MNALTTQDTRTPEVSREREQYIVPDVNIYETKEGYLLEAEMPGVAKDGVEITLEDSELTLFGRRSDQAPQGAEPVLRESHRLNYRRVFELDPTIDTSKIVAKVEQGVLILTLPKAEKVKPRKIEIAE